MTRNVGRLLCIYQHAPTPGAPGIYRHRLYFAELVRRGWKVDLISTPLNYMTGEVSERYRGKPYVHEQIDGVDHHWVWASGRIHASKRRRVANYVSFAATALARGLAVAPPDVVMVSSPPLTVGMLGPALGVRFRVPWILEVRDVWPESAVSVGWLKQETTAYRVLERGAHRLASSASAVIVPTPGLEPYLVRHGARFVAVVPGPVLDAAVGEDERLQARAALGLSPTDRVFCYAGAIGVANGLDVLLDAVGDLPAAVPASVIVAGDGSARHAIERRLAAESISRVRMVGVVPKEQVRTLLAASDVCLHLLRPDPVFQTAQPTKMLEYFGSGKPVITTVPGRPEELAVAAGGAFASGAQELTTELIRWSAMSEDELLRRGQTALSFGLEQFGLARSVDGLEQLLVATINRSDRRRESEPSSA